MRELLSEKDREDIRHAVSRAEKKTSGEIVPCIANRSGRYEVAVWRGAAIGGAVALCFLLIVTEFYQGWGLSWLHTGLVQVLIVIGTGLCAALLTAFVSPVRRMLAGSERLTRTVHRRALQAFVEREVFGTRDRTGILLFVSLFEHRIEVVGDTGINEKVAPEEWGDVVLRVREGIKSDKLATGLIAGITLCGELLERSGVAIRPDDTNELSDDITIQE